MDQKELDLQTLKTAVARFEPDLKGILDGIDNFNQLLSIALDVAPDDHDVIQVVNQLAPVTHLTFEFSRLSRRVCFLERADGAESTAILVGADQILTAAHTLRGTAGIFADPSQVRVRFDHFEWVPGTPAIELTCGLAASADGTQPAVLASSIKTDSSGKRKTGDTKLDYIVVKLDREVGRCLFPYSRRRIRGWVGASRANIPPKPNGEVTVMQHPQGGLLQFSRGHIVALADDGFGIVYDAETRVGSSGAIIADRGRHILGIHIGEEAGHQHGTSFQAIFRDIQKDGIDLHRVFPTFSPAHVKRLRCNDSRLD